LVISKLTNIKKHQSMDFAEHQFDNIMNVI